ncbi:MULTISPECIES: DUF4124 domain-containing protein [unclassified Rhodanobacter]|uniref:DUF4124 domain-containing protein n=1 Tax=unclassified Rhodanobacter TaxID=2621553 RepID=UPI00128FF44C|nr:MULTISPECIES: DUF4124 domain-containing protein [unclassified Rhodanobacter]
MRTRVICFVAGVSMLVFVPASRASDIYKCAGPSGDTIFSSEPCPGHKSKPVLQITPGEVAAAQRHQDIDTLNYLLRQGRFGDATSFAKLKGLLPNLQNRVQRMQQQYVAQQQDAVTNAEESRQAAIAGLADRNAQLSAQNRVLLDEEDRQQNAYEEQLRQRNAAQQVARMQQEAAQQAAQMTPKFNAATGQWCQDVGGFVECH